MPEVFFVTREHGSAPASKTFRHWAEGVSGFVTGNIGLELILLGILPPLIVPDFKLAAPQGFEPRYADPESAVLAVERLLDQAHPFGAYWRSSAARSTGIKWSSS